ncbi:MAG: MarR family winged helix-turn-helix transcriptional regulator [Thermomicrobiales bacterium]
MNERAPSRTDWTHSTCFSTSVRRIDRILSRIYDDAIRPSGLVTTQYSLLSTLARAPADLSLTDLATAIDMDRSTLSRNLAPLERQGFVHLAAGQDRRARIVSITQAGREKVDETRPLWRAAQDRVAALAGGQDVEDTLTMLLTLIDPVRTSSQEGE